MLLNDVKPLHGVGYRIFPCAPGVSWPMRYGAVYPQLPFEILSNILKDKEAIIVNNGGLIESYCSFYLLEALNYNFPSVPLYWSGNPKFHCLLEKNGLAKPFKQISQETINKYPLPLFLNKTNKVFFNCLFNCIKRRTFRGKKLPTSRESILTQIFKNSLISKEPFFLPKWRRNTEFPKDLETWSKAFRYNKNKPFIVIIPEKTGLSHNKFEYLEWTPVQIKSLASILSAHGISTFVFSNNPARYSDYSLYSLPFNLDHALYFIEKCSAVLSADVDFLLIANIISKAKIFSLKKKFGAYSLFKSNRFLGEKNVIYIQKELSPLEVFEQITLKESKSDSFNNDSNL